MKPPFKCIGFAALAIMLLMNSCLDDQVEPEFYAIKSEFVGGKTTSVFKYNDLGKISERESFYFYERYIYDADGSLIKRETAVDPASTSSNSTMQINTTLMTAENSTISSYSLFHYDLGKLTRIENYHDKGSGFQLSSIRTMEYDGERISRQNLHDSNEEVTQFYIYDYDSNGNVINKKHYSYLFHDNPDPRLVNESSFQYDDKKNPFIVFRAMGIPGIYSNTNNYVKTTTTYYDEPGGLPQSSTGQTSYEYNSMGYPIKVIQGSNEYEYRY